MLPEDTLYATADLADVQWKRRCRAALVSVKSTLEADTKGPNLAELGEWILECNIESLDLQVDSSGMCMNVMASYLIYLLGSLRLYYVDTSNHLIIQRVQPLHAEPSINDSPPAREDVLSGLTAISFNPFRVKGDVSQEKDRLLHRGILKRAQLDNPVDAGELLPLSLIKGLRIAVFQDSVRGLVWSDRELLVRLAFGIRQVAC
jgi:hypothetical protein